MTGQVCGDAKHIYVEWKCSTKKFERQVRKIVTDKSVHKYRNRRLLIYIIFFAPACNMEGVPAIFVPQEQLCPMGHESLNSWEVTLRASQHEWRPSGRTSFTATNI